MGFRDLEKETPIFPTVVPLSHPPTAATTGRESVSFWAFAKLLLLPRMPFPVLFTNLNTFRGHPCHLAPPFSVSVTVSPPAQNP